MTAPVSPQGFTSPAIHDGHQDYPYLPTVADAIINKRIDAQASCAALVHNSSGRRWFVDPTTCEKDYSKAEMEFMRAMQLYKQSSGRMFPTWSEVLEVLKGLGYEKVGSTSACT
jgi:hypothetical protein